MKCSRSYWFCRRSIEFRGISNESIFINKLTSLIDTAMRATIVSGHKNRINVYGDFANDGSVKLYSKRIVRIFLQNVARHRLALLVLLGEKKTFSHTHKQNQTNY